MSVFFIQDDEMIAWACLGVFCVQSPVIKAYKCIKTDPESMEPPKSMKFLLATPLNDRL